MAASIRQSMLAGAVAGVMLMSSLLAVCCLAWRLAGLPFAAFDVFDWMARTLPGSVVTFGIDAIVSVIRTLNLGATAETAKIAEKTMAIAGFLVAGAIAGAVLFVLLRAFRGHYAYPLGVAIGAAVGVPVTFISRSVGQTTSVGPISSAVWILAAFLIWGAGLG